MMTPEENRAHKRELNRRYLDKVRSDPERYAAHLERRREANRRWRQKEAQR